MQATKKIIRRAALHSSLILGVLGLTGQAWSENFDVCLRECREKPRSMAQAAKCVKVCAELKNSNSELKRYYEQALRILRGDIEGNIQRDDADLGREESALRQEEKSLAYEEKQIASEESRSSQDSRSLKSYSRDLKSDPAKREHAIIKLKALPKRANGKGRYYSALKDKAQSITNGAIAAIKKDSKAVQAYIKTLEKEIKSLSTSDAKKDTSEMQRSKRSFEGFASLSPKGRRSLPKDTTWWSKLSNERLAIAYFAPRAKAILESVLSIDANEAKDKRAIPRLKKDIQSQSSQEQSHRKKEHQDRRKIKSDRSKMQSTKHKRSASERREKKYGGSSKHHSSSRRGSGRSGSKYGSSGSSRGSGY